MTTAAPSAVQIMTRSGTLRRSAIVVSLILHAAFILGVTRVVLPAPAPVHRETRVDVELVVRSTPRPRVVAPPHDVPVKRTLHEPAPAPLVSPALPAPPQSPPERPTLVSTKPPARPVVHPEVDMGSTVIEDAAPAGSAQVVPDATAFISQVHRDPGGGVWIERLSQSPRVLQEVKAPYPDEARRRGIQGPVTLLVTVDATGAVTDVKCVTGLGFGLDEAAIEALKAFHFSPALAEGAPVTSQIHYTYLFKIEDGVR